IASSHRVIAPDLPGHGASDIGDAELDADRVLAWLAELIERTCESAPALLGHLGSGAIATRLAIAQAPPLHSLVLVDSFGLGRFRPAPRFALALFRYVARPTPRTYAALMNHCTVDLAGVRTGLGERWDAFESYTLDRARSAECKAALRLMMRALAVPAISPRELARIAVPVTLIWGRHDPVNRLPVAKAASERYGWPLEVIEEAGDDPPLEQPRAFLCALRPALAFGESAKADGLFEVVDSDVYSEPIEERSE